MSERGTFRGGRGGGSGGQHHRGGGRGGSSNANRGGAQTSTTDRPKKENILDLGKYMEKEVTVKFNGGREGKSFNAVERAGGKAAGAAEATEAAKAAATPSK